MRRFLLLVPLLAIMSVKPATAQELNGRAQIETFNAQGVYGWHDMNASKENPRVFALRGMLNGRSGAYIVEPTIYNGRPKITFYVDNKTGSMHTITYNYIESVSLNKVYKFREHGSIRLYYPRGG